VTRVPSFKLFPHQRQALKCIESWAAGTPVHPLWSGTPAQPVYYVKARMHGAPEEDVVVPIGAEHWRDLKRFTPPPPRFNTPRLAAKLARALHSKTP